MRNLTRAAIVAANLALLVGSAVLIAGPSGTPARQQAAQPGKTWTASQALPFTCAQAWVASGKNYTHLLAIVETLAKVSLANRNLTFPDTKEAGLDAGNGIAADCKADPNGLLFAIVDRHVRRVAEAAAVAGK